MVNRGNPDMSDRFHFQYELHEDGWATAGIRHGDVAVDMVASYLHDSLHQLAQAAYSLSCGPGTTHVIFMDELGEHQLTLTREQGPDCFYSVNWFDDWNSRGIRALTESNRICDGTVPVRRFVQQVHTALWSLLEEFGESGYKERWCAHEFPLTEMHRLVDISSDSPATTD